MKKTGDPKYTAFDTRELAKNLKQALLGALEDDEADAVARLAVDRIALDIEVLSEPLTDARYRHVGSPFTHYIQHTDVRTYMLGALHSVGLPPGGGGSARHRVAYVLYGLKTLGSVGSETKGFNDARDVVAWLKSVFGDLPQVDISPPRGRPVDRWWPPTPGPPTVPKTVIKRHAKLRRRGDPPRSIEKPRDGADGMGGVEYPPSAADLTANGRSMSGVATVPGVPFADFWPDKFRKSIENALAGRPNRQETADQVAQWVLWHLVGQEVVLTSQLGAAVAECLRRVDDVAYLRWVTVGKELRVSSIYREACGLVEHPSPRLVFDPAGMPHPLPPKTVG